MKAIRLLTGWVMLLAIFQTGCVFSPHRIKDSEELRHLNPKDNLTLLTADGARYDLTTYDLDKDFLIGTGTVEINKKRAPFQGRLNLKDIEYVQVRKEDFWETAGFIGIGVFAVAEISQLSQTYPATTVQETTGYYPYGTGGSGSCPFIYAYDGQKYHLDAEVIENNVCKGMENKDADQLSHLKAVNGHYRLKLTNERPETHYLGVLKLLAVDAPSQAQVYPDETGVFHTVSDPVPPSQCVEFGGKNALDQVLKEDGKEWVSDLTSKDFTQDNDLRDGLLVDFPKPPTAQNAKLLLHASNTSLITFAFSQIAKLKGRNLLRWYKQLDEDPKERAKILQAMKREAYLKVEVKEGDQWVTQAWLPNIGPELYKDQIVLLDLHQVPGKTLQVRLGSTTGVWRIDQLEVDYTPDQPIEIHEAALERAMDMAGKDLRKTLTDDDQDYYVTVRGQKAELTFAEVPVAAGKTRSFIVRSKGFYYHWFEEGKADLPELYETVLREPNFAARMILPLWNSMQKNKK